MKIRQHNSSTSIDSIISNPDKQSRIVTRQNPQKTRTILQKQNIIPNQNIPNPKKTNKQITNIQADKKIQNIQSSIKIQHDTVGKQLLQYEKDIMKYLKSKQCDNRISGNYLRNHEYISHQSRATYIKYFFKLAKRFTLKRTTVFLATYYMDCYFQKNPQLQKKQAIISALACIFIAMKYQQIYPPQLYQWTQATKQIILAQSHILKCLNFNLCYTSVEHYLQYYFNKIQIVERDKDMIRLIADVSLFDQTMYNYTPSELAAAIIYSIANRNKLEQKMEMSLKWMIQRNQKFMQWLQTIKIRNWNNL